MRVIIVGTPKRFEILGTFLRNERGIDGQPYVVAQTSEQIDLVTDLLDGTEQYEIALVFLEDVELVTKIAAAVPVAIVLTFAFNVQVCVEMLRQGAWDYIDMSVHDDIQPLDRLVASMAAGCRARRLTRAADDAAWIQNNMEQLVLRHAGEWVAVANGDVRRHARGYDLLIRQLTDEDEAALLWRLPEKYPWKP